MTISIPDALSGGDGGMMLTARQRCWDRLTALSAAPLWSDISINVQGCSMTPATRHPHCFCRQQGSDQAAPRREHGDLVV
jgi:hypothetical protein